MSYARELFFRVVGFPVAAFALLFVTAELASLLHPPFVAGTAAILLGGAALGVWLAAKILRPGLAAVAEAWSGILAGRTTPPLAANPRGNARRAMIDLVAAAGGLVCAVWLFRAGARDAALAETFAGVVLAFSATFFSAGTAVPRIVAARRAAAPSGGPRRAPLDGGAARARSRPSMTDPILARAPVRFLALATAGLALSFAVADRLPAVRFRGKPWPLSYGTWVHACAIAGGNEWCPPDGSYLVIPRSARDLRVEWSHSGPCLVRFTDAFADKQAYLVLRDVRPGQPTPVRVEPTSRADTCWYSLRYRTERP